MPMNARTRREFMTKVHHEVLEVTITIFDTTPKLAPKNRSTNAQYAGIISALLTYDENQTNSKEIMFTTFRAENALLQKSLMNRREGVLYLFIYLLVYFKQLRGTFRHYAKGGGSNIKLNSNSTFPHNRNRKKRKTMKVCNTYRIIHSRNWARRWGLLGGTLRWWRDHVVAGLARCRTHLE